MNIEQLIADLRARVNPQYYDQIGTESYERHQVVKALEYLATENERLKEAQQQPAVAWMIHEYQGTGEKRLQFQPHIPSIRDDVTGPIVTALYARPVPSAPAVAAPYVPFSDDDMAEVHQLAYELGGTDGGEYILDGEQLDQVIVKAASLFYKPAVAVPAVSEDFQIAAQNLIDAAGTSTCSPTRCQYPMDCCKMELIGAMDAVSALLQSATVEPNVSTLTLNAADSAQSEQEGMILMPVKADEALVAGFVGCETREEAMLGWDVAVWIQEVRTGKRKLVDPVHFNEAEVIRLQKKLDETREELRNTRERLAERLKAIEPPFEVVNPACQACGDGTTSLCDHEDCPSGRFRGYDPMNRLIASDPKMKNPNCPREQIAKCVDGFCVKEVTGHQKCDGHDNFIADAVSAPRPEIKEITVAEAQEICSVSCAIGAYPQVLSAEVTRLQAQVAAMRNMTLQIINVHVIADDIPGPSEKARRYYNRLAERFGVDRLENGL